MKKKNKKRRLKKKVKILLILTIIIILSLLIFILFNFNKNSINEEKIDINNYYSQYIKTKKDIVLYNSNNEEEGLVGKNIILKLEEVNNELNKFKTIINQKEYYIDYKDLEKIESDNEKSDRYKNYIVFNENIITDEEVEFYDEENNLVYKIKESFNLPIIIKDDDKYGVEFNNSLLYVKDSDIKQTIDNKNTQDKNSTGIPVLNYHFVFEDNDNTCNEEICHSATQIKQHFSYIKDNNFFTPTMKELEMYIDGKLQLPQKSVSITFDDGTRAEVAKKYVDEYEVNATLFLITSWFGKEDFASKYFEVHSHGDNIHNAGVCPGGQGGAIKCMEKDKLLADLKTSREKLDNSTVFCYPFYEYNDYSIEMLKEAGFTMAFAGERAGGKITVEVNADKFRLPRWIIVNWTTMDQFISYVNGGS